LQNHVAGLPPQVTIIVLRPGWAAAHPGGTAPALIPVKGAGTLGLVNYNLFQHLMFHKTVILSAAKNLVFLNT
jgi:hypothetical protein